MKRVGGAFEGIVCFVLAHSLNMLICSAFVPNFSVASQRFKLSYLSFVSCFSELNNQRKNE